jgi:hypothetical protein
MSRYPIIVIVVYLIPTLVALYRHHKSTGGIAIVNILLGWTVIGWIIALAWAGSDAGHLREIVQRGPETVTLT